jgi:5-methylcytosine-specific restriction endonuclease McrA
MTYAKPKDAVKSWRERCWRKERLSALGFTMEQYDNYLATPHWQAFRKQAFAEQRKNSGHNYCNRCLISAGTLHVHHLTYERLGKESVEDVEIVCRDCHHKEHETTADRRARLWREAQRSPRMRLSR